jgi:two-component system, sensor histidine kinase YesM
MIIHDLLHVIIRRGNFMSFINNIKLKRKLLLAYLIIIAAPLVAVNYSLTAKLYNEAFSNTIQLSNASIKQLSDNLSEKLMKYEGIINSIFNNTVFRDYIGHIYDSEYESYIDLKNNVIPILPILPTAFIRVYTNNRTIGFSGFTNNLLADLEGVEWFNTEIMTSKLQWSKPIKINKLDTRNFVVIYRKMMDFKDLSYSKVLAVFFDENELFSLVKKEKDIGEKIIFFYNDKGEMITTTERANLNKNIAELYNNNGSTFNSIKDNTIINYNGNRYYFMKLYINNVQLNINNWAIIYMIPAKGIVSNLKNILLFSILLGILCIVFSFTLIYLISENITGRIRNLINSMKIFKDNNLKKPLKITGNDEIGLLERDFNNMVKKIDNVIKEVYLANLKVKDKEISDNGYCTNNKVTIDAIIIYVREHCCEDINLESISKKYFLNTAYLGRLFKNKTDMKCNEFIHNCRIDIAARLLEKSDLTISEICTRTGYKELNYFEKIFKEKKSMSPSGYRSNITLQKSAVHTKYNFY